MEGGLVMMHITYTILESDTHGVGVFVEENVPQGARIYTPSPLLDVDLTQEEFESLDQREQKEVQYYGYFHKPSVCWHVAYDAIRMMNHADGDHANTTQDEDMVLVAKRDIQAGEELLQDYCELFDEDDEHFGRILGNPKLFSFK